MYMQGLTLQMELYDMTYITSDYNLPMSTLD